MHRIIPGRFAPAIIRVKSRQRVRRCERTRVPNVTENSPTAEIAQHCTDDSRFHPLSLYLSLSLFTFRQQSSRVACVQLTPFPNSVSIPSTLSPSIGGYVPWGPRYEIAFRIEREKSFSIENAGKHRNESVRNVNCIIKFNNEGADDKGHCDK